MTAADVAADPDLQALAWPLDRLGEALEALARAAGFAPRAAEALQPPATPGPAAAQAGLQDWLNWASARLGRPASCIFRASRRSVAQG